MDPTPTPETTSQPETSARGRKISWVALWTVLFVPLWLAIGVLSFMAMALAEHLLRSYHLAALVPAPVLTQIGVFFLTAWLTAWLTRRGLQRGWNSPQRLRRGWSFTVALVIALAAGGYLHKRKMGESTANKVVTSQARQLSVAADQYFLENGVSTVSYDSLVGMTNYVKAVFPTHQEIYPANYTQGITITIMNVAGTRTVTYAP